MFLVVLQQQQKQQRGAAAPISAQAQSTAPFGWLAAWPRLYLCWQQELFSVAPQGRCACLRRLYEAAGALKQVLLLQPPKLLLLTNLATGNAHATACTAEQQAVTSDSTCEGKHGLGARVAGALHHARVLVAELVVEVLAHFLEHSRADLRELDLAKLRFGEGACATQPAASGKAGWREGPCGKRGTAPCELSMLRNVLDTHAAL